MSIHDKIEALGNELSTDVLAVLHEIATLAGAVAPDALAVEAVVAPEAVAPTEAAEKIADAISADTGPIGTTASNVPAGANGPSNG